MSGMFQPRVPFESPCWPHSVNAGGATPAEHWQRRGTSMSPFSFKRTAVAGLLALTTVGATLGVAAAQQAPAWDPTNATDPSSSEQVAQMPQPPGQPGRPGRGEG